ncbi:MAG: hypothetical protein ACRDDJ_20530 [[Mycobacterium] stephanolepidis]
MVAKADRSYAGETADARRERRRLQLLEAAFDLLAESGRDQMSKRRVIAAANLNDRYFNENFASIDQLMETVYAWQLGELAAHFAMVSASVRGGMRERIQANVQATMSFLVDDPRRAALLSVGHGGDESLMELRQQAAFLVASAMVSEAIKGEVPLPHGRRHLELSTLLIANGAIDLVTLWVGGRLGSITADELQGTLVNLIVDAGGVTS